MPNTVMIVEDNELNMKLFHDLLEAHGYHTIGTRNGMEALDLARKHRPDSILMDIQLPEVSGLEVTKWLKEDPGVKAIPVIAVTAFAMKGDEERIRQGGCEAYMSKPISVATFIQTIRRFLGIGLSMPAVRRGTQPPAIRARHADIGLEASWARDRHTLARHRGAARGAGGAQSAHRHARRGLARDRLAIDDAGARAQADRCARAEMTGFTAATYPA
jgi:two-component system cell cycle response regulator DivK